MKTVVSIFLAVPILALTSCNDDDFTSAVRAAECSALFASHDIDNSGSLDPAEFDAALNDGYSQAASQNIAIVLPTFERADSDGNGEVDDIEAQAACENIYYFSE